MQNLEGLVICKGCLVDEYLIDGLVFKSGIKQKCTNCKKQKICADYKSLALKLKDVISNYFNVVPEDGRYWELAEYQNEGTNFRSTLEGILGHDIAEIDSIIEFICTQDGWSARDGGVRFFVESARFERRTEYADQFHKQWCDLVFEIKTKRRFFSDTARKLFEQIFEEVENLTAYPQHESGIGYSNTKVPVVRTIVEGTRIFRARKCDSKDACSNLIKNPNKELSPPPPQFAQQGRMNAKGVSIFYGATDRKTCIAEMRSSIGNYLVLGSFETVKDIRVLDFKLLESFISKISYFQPNANYQLKRRAFLYNLHSLISAPVITGHDDDYLITQLLAEYLAYVRPKNFDGISFESTQLKGGTNIILFPKEEFTGIRVPELGEEYKVRETQSVLKKFGLEFIEDSVDIYQTEQITYETRPIGMYNLI